MNKLSDFILDLLGGSLVMAVYLIALFLLVGTIAAQLL